MPFPKLKNKIMVLPDLPCWYTWFCLREKNKPKQEKHANKHQPPKAEYRENITTQWEA